MFLYSIPDLNNVLFSIIRTIFNFNVQKSNLMYNFQRVRTGNWQKITTRTNKTNNFKEQNSKKLILTNVNKLDLYQENSLTTTIVNKPTNSRRIILIITHLSYNPL